MTLPNLARRGAGAIVGAALSTVLALAQSGASPIGPLRTAPTEKFTVNPGFRDWAPTTIAGTTILGGNSSNRGGLFAVDTLTGKVKWTSRHRTRKSVGRDRASCLWRHRHHDHE